MPDYLTIARRAVDDPKQVNQSLTLEDVLRGVAVELWSDSSGRLFIVADEEDASRMGVPRGIVYTAAELRRIVRISDPVVVREIHEWKRAFNATIRESSR